MSEIIEGNVHKLSDRTIGAIRLLALSNHSMYVWYVHREEVVEKRLCMKCLLPLKLADRSDTKSLRMLAVRFLMRPTDFTSPHPNKNAFVRFQSIVQQNMPAQNE